MENNNNGELMSFNSYLGYLKSNLDNLDPKQIDNFIEVLYKAYTEDKMIFVIGNGGSAANASHFAQDLAKGTKSSIDEAKRIKALSLTDNTAFISALGNDEGYENIFEQQLKTFAKEGDVVVAISGSGNSRNIIKAIDWANNNKLVTVGITGFNGGDLLKKNHYSVHVALDDMCTAESIHSILCHYVVIELKAKIEKDAINYAKYLLNEKA